MYFILINGKIIVSLLEGEYIMKPSFKNQLYSWGRSILFALILVIICRYFIFSPIAVHGESMLPTFEDNDRLVISKVSSIERFDIVVFEAPHKNEQYIKRVIGIPGDSVQVKDDVLYINGTAHEEKYVNKKLDLSLYNKLTGDFKLQDYTSEKTVPEGHYFVLGDNRWKSSDSREFGFISANSIIGEVKFRYYPFQDTGIPK